MDSPEKSVPMIAKRLIESLDLPEAQKPTQREAILAWILSGPKE